MKYEAWSVHLGWRLYRKEEHWKTLFYLITKLKRFVLMYFMIKHCQVTTGILTNCISYLLFFLSIFMKNSFIKNQIYFLSFNTLWIHFQFPNWISKTNKFWYNQIYYLIYSFYNEILCIINNLYNNCRLSKCYLCKNILASLILYIKFHQMFSQFVHINSIVVSPHFLLFIDT